MTARFVNASRELGGQPLGLGQDLGVVHRHRRRPGEQLPDPYCLRPERVLRVGVDVQRTHHPVRQQQRQRQHAVHTHPPDPRTEPGPAGLPAERPGRLRAPGLDRQQARAFAQPVLHVVDRMDELRAGDHRLRPVVLQHRQPGAFRARDRLHRELRDVDQRLLQRPVPRQQPRQPGQALLRGRRPWISDPLGGAHAATSETVDLPDDRWSAAGTAAGGDPVTERAATRSRSASRPP